MQFCVYCLCSVYLSADLILDLRCVSFFWRHRVLAVMKITSLNIYTPENIQFILVQILAINSMLQICPIYAAHTLHVNIDYLCCHYISWTFNQRVLGKDCNKVLFKDLLRKQFLKRSWTELEFIDTLGCAPIQNKFISEIIRKLLQKPRINFTHSIL